MIDPANYSTLKSQNNIVSISQAEDVITITSKLFDPVTGLQQANEVDTFSAAALAAQISQYQTSISNLNAVIASLQAVLTDAG